MIVSVSGVRGIVGRGLTPEVAGRFAAALGTYLDGGPVVLSRDGRPSGDMLASAAAAQPDGRRLPGDRLRHRPDADRAAWPSAINAAAGGLQVTASHNPAPWNGLKLFGPDGAVLPPAEGEKVQAIFEAGRFRTVPWNEIGTRQAIANPFRPHRDTVLYLLDVEKLRRCQFDVLLDANGGAGGEAGPGLAPRPRLHGDTARLRRGRRRSPTSRSRCRPISATWPGRCGERGVAAGFVLDPDADRLALIDETGRYLGEELTLALAVQYRLAPGARAGGRQHVHVARRRGHLRPLRRAVLPLGGRRGERGRAHARDRAPSSAARATAASSTRGSAGSATRSSAWA